MADEIRVLVLGDVVGSPGKRALFFALKNLIKEQRADLVVVNGENAADGFGMSPEDYQNICESGADVVTSGNHIWQKKEILKTLDEQERLLRPANYPRWVPGHGLCVVEKRGKRIAVINLQGRSRMVFNGSCPFREAGKILAGLKADEVIVDFHAEDPMEKEALALYLDGTVSLLIGTHTHVQTADEKILPGGCGYITDVGMVGPKGSVIGSDPAVSIRRCITQLPLKMEVLEAPAQICGISVLLEGGRCRRIHRICQSADL